MSNRLAGTPLRLQVIRKEEVLKRGWGELPSWIFCTEVGTSLDENRVRKVFTKTLPTAGLPGHFSPHTYGSLLLQQGRWLPAENQAAVNRLDDPSGSEVAAKAESATPDAPEVADLFGGPSRTRTLDHSDAPNLQQLELWTDPQ